MIVGLRENWDATARRLHVVEEGDDTARIGATYQSMVLRIAALTHNGDDSERLTFLDLDVSDDHPVVHEAQHVFDLDNGSRRIGKVGLHLCPDTIPPTLGVYDLSEPGVKLPQRVIATIGNVVEAHARPL